MSADAMDWNALTGSLDIATLHAAYRAGALTPAAVVAGVLQRMARGADARAWIARVPEAQLAARAQALTALLDEPDALMRYPLLGIPFAVKDNIDVAGMPTTAACPEFAYEAARSATVVRKLLDAGAMLVGKTNLDQFATGLVGVRSPYGAPRNTFHPDYLPGGSSSGSAVVVAGGVVSFALGTDTAGSGRVPAALNNIVGLKPTRGLLSDLGVLPACRSLDCVSVFALTHADALAVADVAAGFDPEDLFSRRRAAWQRLHPVPAPKRFRFAVPAVGEREFFGDEASARGYEQALERLAALGGTPVEIDFQPFRDAAALLYQGPWIVERYLVAGELLARDADAVHPDVRRALAKAREFDAQDAFKAYYRLKELRRAVEGVFAQAECLVVPTIGRPYRIDEVAAAPAQLNANLGYYTNYVNLLDLCAVAVPAGMLPAGVPFGVTLIGMPFTENRLCALGDALQRAAGVTLGATGQPLPPAPPAPADAQEDRVRLCVSGAHMDGLALNHQLIGNHAQLVCATRTAPRYRLYALEHLSPPRPGMVREDDGVAIEVEVWEMPKDRFGWFVADIPAPLGIGRVELDGGASLPGFLCEPYAVRAAKDISALGGWRAYLATAG